MEAEAAGAQWQHTATLSSLRRRKDFVRSALTNPAFLPSLAARLWLERGKDHPNSPVTYKHNYVPSIVNELCRQRKFL